MNELELKEEGNGKIQSEKIEYPVPPEEVVEEEPRRWLYHDKYKEKIFEPHEIRSRLSEGWKKWPWELNVSRETIKEHVEQSTEAVADVVKRRGRPPRVQ